jgi:hypothetical protein
MTPNDHDSNSSCSDRSNQSLVSDRLVEIEPGFSRREFLGMTTASLLMARSLSASASAGAKNGIPYRPLGRTGEKVSLVGLGGYHLARQSDLVLLCYKLDTLG